MHQGGCSYVASWKMRMRISFCCRHDRGLHILSEYYDIHRRIIFFALISSKSNTFTRSSNCTSTSYYKHQYNLGYPHRKYSCCNSRARCIYSTFSVIKMNSTLSPSVETTNENNASASANNESKTKDIISTKSLDEIEGIQFFELFIRMTRHQRYKDQEIKYKRKDSKLLGLGLRCLNNDKDFEVGGLFVPLDETSKSVQKKFRNVVRAHRSDWDFKLRQLYDTRQLFESSSYEAEVVAKFVALAESIKNLLPKVNGKTVLDVSRMSPVVTANDQLRSTLLKVGTVHQVLFKCLSMSMQVKSCQSSTINVIPDYDEFLGLFPMRTQEHNTDEYARFVTPDFMIANLMGVALRANHNDSVAVLRGYAAALRLWSASEDDEKVQERIYQDIRNKEIVPDLLYHTVVEKFEDDTARPFFSINKIKRLEDELGIGMYSKNNYKCNTCGVDCDNAKLKKCSGCSRVWYCGYECQKRNWSKHKPVCKAKWRTKPLYYETSGHYEDMKGQMMSSSLCIQVDAVTNDLFVFCLDPITNEVFDGVTDRPVSFLPPSDGDGTDSKKTTSITVNVASQRLAAAKQRAAKSHTDALAANETFLEARTKHDVARAKLVDLEAKYDVARAKLVDLEAKLILAEIELTKAEADLLLAQQRSNGALS